MLLSIIRKNAEALVKLLEPFCDRIEIAGSIRREKEQCKDIELVCIPNKSGVPLFSYLNSLHFSGTHFTKNGMKWKRFLWEGIWVDLFITDEEHWGVCFLLRTGSKEFNFKILEALKRGEYTLSDLEIRNALGELQIAREETDIFKIIKAPFIDPRFRK
jgi:DNA polymerase/3'-5' exonuclease PolX